MILTNLTNNHDRILYDTTLELLAIRRDKLSNNKRVGSSLQDYLLESDCFVMHLPTR